MSTISGGSKPEFTGNEVLKASELNLATHHWVATEVPDNSVGRDGDIVFVPGDNAPNSELPGIGGWATITEVTGDYTKHTYGDWVAYEWTDDGSATCTSGLLDTWIVAAGSVWAAPNNGSGGEILDGLRYFAGDTHDVIVGAPATDGKSSAFGDLITRRTYPPYADHGAGAGGYTGASDRTLPRYGSITGTSLPYSAGRNGSTSPVGHPGGMGTAGTVIIRVPAANAQNVTENYFRFVYHATVEDSVVVSVTKTPDNQTYKTAVDEVECDSSVQVGYTYDEKKNTFAAPEPDYSEEIAALTARLEELRNV